MPGDVADDQGIPGAQVVQRGGELQRRALPDGGGPGVANQSRHALVVSATYDELIGGVHPR